MYQASAALWNRQAVDSCYVMWARGVGLVSLFLRGAMPFVYWTVSASLWLVRNRVGQKKVILKILNTF